MIYCPELDKEYDDKEVMFKELAVASKSIIAQKKSVIKSGFSVGASTIKKANEKTINALKSLSYEFQNPILGKSIDYTKQSQLKELIVKATSSTTNWFDSHKDVHIDGCFNQTILLNKKDAFPHIQMHKSNDFASIISENCETSVQKTNFKNLGFDYDFDCEALKFKSVIDPNRNIFMYNQYANGWVNNHSIGMIYVTIKYCANSEVDDMKPYKENYDLYYSKIANKADVDVCGYFWAVIELKLIEHSAVPKGSNCTTPTDSVEIEADDALEQKQAAETLQIEQKNAQISIEDLKKNFNI